MEDPISELYSEKDFIITFKERINSKIIEEVKEKKKKLISELEELRLKCTLKGITFEDQLNLEYQGVIQAISICLEENYDFDTYMTLIGIPLYCWEQISGKPHDIKGLIEFYKSEYYRKMPYNNIRAKLFASIITNKSRVDSGDSIDITNISSMAPYCNLILTDRKMRNRVHALKISEDYDVKVFSLNEYKELTEYLRSI
ncbi:hypothetical protein [Cellulosilyticum sp. I15G10I2]|uniref:hypothetical protein n=1 Tax=Cellulosilyticum sp. I15G10I2 TaxID=1892843 RepID=UPI00085C7654|nr:hypothetical protein [Cellulosilyticum sp. I15G10I2]